MKTSVIRYRVADFLKQYPPFNELSAEDLLSLAASGRVVFHESDEYIFRKNQPKTSSICVIQQGSVEIIDDTPHGDQLRDLLGEGDLLGIETGSIFRNSAKTTSDVILYTIDADQFAQLASRNSRVSSYLAAISSGYADDARSCSFHEIEIKAIGRTTWLDDPGPPIDYLRRHLVTVGPGTTIRDAASKMAQAASDWCAIQDENRQPLGIVTARELRNHLAHGGLASPTEAIMNPNFATAEADLTVGEYFTRMMQQSCRAIAVTADGTEHSALEGVVTDADLSLSGGQNPALLLERISESTTSQDRSLLLQHAGRLLASALASPSNIDLCAQMWTEFQNATLQSIIRQSESELADEGFSKPSANYCWLLFGRAGRNEAVVPFQPEIGLIYDDCLTTANGADSSEYFPAIFEKTLSYLAECGLPPVADRVLDETTILCQSIAQWKTIFQERIADPIGNSVHRSRTLFDFQPLSVDRGLVSELKQAIASALKESGPFIPIMANDTMSNLPPLTFFHGLVVELDGAQRDTLDVEATALGPITDAARVFALAAENLDVTNTLARLEHAASALPAHSSVLREAAQAFRVTAYQQAIANFAGAGATIRPSNLGRYDQRLLKTAFDAIQRLLEVSSSVFDVAA
jgi:CBS domain-containing protein